VNPALGPFAIAALLLVLGGVAKALRPHDTAVAVELAGLPVNDAVVRAGGVAEAVLGVVALVTVDVPVAVLVALSYAAFCSFVALAMVRGLPIRSCGCFGKVDTPPDLVHLGITAGAFVAAVGMALDTGASPLDAATDHGTASTVYVVLTAIGVLATFALLTVVPRARLRPRAVV
jgi:methylamine utilization protein MauE